MIAEIEREIGHDTNVKMIIRFASQFLDALLAHCIEINSKKMYGMKNVLYFCMCWRREPIQKTAMVSL